MEQRLPSDFEAFYPDPLDAWYQVNVRPVSAGVTLSLSFQARVVSQGRWTSQAQILTATPADPNSTPGNGSDNGEDDTATADLRVDE